MLDPAAAAVVVVVVMVLVACHRDDICWEAGEGKACRSMCHGRMIGGGTSECIDRCVCTERIFVNRSSN